MKKSYLDPTASFATALVGLVRACRVDLFEIQELRTKLNGRLQEAAAIHYIDPAAVRRLLRVLVQSDANDTINNARQEEIDAAYKVIVKGAAPVMPSRVDTELDKVMRLVSNGKPPKINDIMKAIPCSAGKASKLRRSAAARLAAESSSSQEKRENETPVPEHVPGMPRSLQERMLQPAPDQEGTAPSAELESMSAPVDTSNVVSLRQSECG